MCARAQIARAQIYSFDELETHTRWIVLIGVEPIIDIIQPFHSRTSKSNLRHQLQVTSLLIFGAKRRRQVDLSRLRRSLTAASPRKQFFPENKFGPEIHEFDLWQVYHLACMQTLPKIFPFPFHKWRPI